jgi:hypothetical protein
VPACLPAVDMKLAAAVLWRLSSSALVVHEPKAYHEPVASAPYLLCPCSRGAGQSFLCCHEACCGIHQPTFLCLPTPTPAAEELNKFLDGLGLGMISSQLRDLNLGELLDTPPPGVDEAVAVSKVGRAAGMRAAGMQFSGAHVLGATLRGCGSAQ